MDSGWAVVLGAVLALVGTSVVPWIRGEVETKHQRRDSRHAALVEAIRALLLEMNAQYVAGPAEYGSKRFRERYAREESVLLALDLLLEIKEQRLSLITRNAFAMIREDVDWRIQRRAITRLHIWLPAWLRGTMTAIHVEREYRSDVGFQHLSNRLAEKEEVEARESAEDAAKDAES